MLPQATTGLERGKGKGGHVRTKGPRIGAIAVAGIVAGLAALEHGRAPALAAENLEARAFDIAEVVRPFPQAGLPGGPGLRTLVLGGGELEDFLRRPGALWDAGLRDERAESCQCCVSFVTRGCDAPGCPPSLFPGPWDQERQHPPGPALDSGQPGSGDLSSAIRQQLRALLGIGEAECWAEGQVLSVRAPLEALASVEGFLGELRREARTRIIVQAILLPAEALDEIRPSWVSEGPFLPEEVFESAVLDPRSRLIEASARSGQSVMAGSRDSRPVVLDSDVNQTGVIPVANPVVHAPPAGEWLIVLPSLLPGKEAVWLDLSVGRILLDVESRTVTGDWAAFQFPVTQKTWISTSAALTPGRVLVTGSTTASGGLAALVRVRIRRPEEPAKAETGKTEAAISVFDIALLQGRARRAWPPRIVESGFWSAAPRLPWEAERLLDHFKALGIGAPVSLVGTRLFFSGSRAAELRSLLSRELEEVSRLAAVDVRVFKVRRAQLAAILDGAEEGAVLEEGSLKALEEDGGTKVERYFVAGPLGQALGFFAAKQKAFATDVEQVSGGTGYAVLEVSDPEVSWCGDGTELFVQADSTADPARLRITLGALSAKIVEEERVAVRFPVLTPTSREIVPGPSSEEEPSPGVVHVLTPKEVYLTLPRQDIRVFSAEVEAPADRAVVLKVDARQGDRATLLIGRARLVR